MSEGTFNTSIYSERPEYGEAPYSIAEFQEVVNKGIKPFLGKNSEQKVLARVGEVATSVLKRFGYLDHYNTVVSAVKAFQKNYGLKQDGKIGPVTYKNMTLPRCGFPDIIKGNEEAQRFLKVAQSKWNKEELTYFVDKYCPKKLSKSDQLSLLRAAFDSWENCPIKLKFRQTNQPGSADIIISCEKGRKFGFDGQGGTLAWAYIPQGDDSQLFLVFDYDEIFVKEVSTYGEIKYQAVAAHEIGHTIGLLHTQKKKQLLFFAYDQDIWVPQWEDVERAQNIYGVPDIPTNPSPGPSPQPTGSIVSVVTNYSDGGNVTAYPNGEVEVSTK